MKVFAVSGNFFHSKCVLLLVKYAAVTIKRFTRFIDGELNDELKSMISMRTINVHNKYSSFYFTLSAKIWGKFHFHGDFIYYKGSGL